MQLIKNKMIVFFFLSFFEKLIFTYRFKLRLLNFEMCLIKEI
jgi:hypothetical protein